MHSENHVFSESLVHSFIASLFSSFIDSSVHWFIDSLLCWFIDSLVLSVTCMDSFMSFHRYLSHIFSVVDAPHNFMPSLLLHLKTGYFFPIYIYIHSGFKFSKLSPRCGPGTTWYNWCLEIPLKLVLWYSKDEIGWKSCHERVVASCCVANRGPGSTEPVPQLEKNLCTALTEPKHILSKFVEPLYTGTSPSHCASNVSYSSSLSHNWSSTSPHVFCYWKFVWLARTLH